MYKNCDWQEKKYETASKATLEAAKEQKTPRELASIYKKHLVQISK